MNKKLLIAAVGAALVAGPMLAAHAAPTVYGKFNVGIAAVDNGNSANGDTLGVTDDSSRLGVKGSEDLGGGLKAVYGMELLYDVDDNTGVSGAGRSVSVGLQGSWGTFRAGHYQTYYKKIQFPAEIMGDSIADWSTNGWQGDSRIPNAIGYQSPTWSGFTFGVESSRGETGLSTESNPTTIAASFTSGPFYIGVGFEDRDNQGATGLDKTNKVVATFDIDAFKIVAAMQTQDALGGSTEVDTTVLGGQYSFGNNAVMVTFAQHDSSVANADCDQTSVGFAHKLSKLTTVRAIYSSIDNESAAVCQGRMIGAASLGLGAPTAGSDPSGFQAQIVLNF
ncbi:MAG: porin [Sulfuricaulis sp.]|uniref:porin n=1 Tax=Sulfuricaulis sp. TaxID=2003553 RepID=UPI0034A2BA9B